MLIDEELGSLIEYIAHINLSNRCDSDIDQGTPSLNSSAYFNFDSENMTYICVCFSRQPQASIPLASQTSRNGRIKKTQSRNLHRFVRNGAGKCRRQSNR
jgi:hypothetical protein